MRRSVLRPRTTKDVKRIRGSTAQSVIGRPHDELSALCQLAELANNEMVTKNGVIEEHVVLLKARRINRIIVLSVIPDRNIGGGNDVLDET